MINFGGIFRALKYKNYRLFFGGQSISLIGTWLTRVATGWLVYRLSHSAFLLGFVSFVGQIPTFMIAPFAGVFVDRWNRHRLLVVTQILLMAQALTLAVLTLQYRIAIWHIVVLSAVQGIVNAFDIPARQSFVIEMVEKREDLGNAIALNSSMFNSARLIGPAIAGVLIAMAGEGYCFLLDGFSYVAVVLSLILMKIKPARKEKPANRMLSELKEGFVHTFGSGPIKSILFLVAAVSLIAMSYMVLLPVFARDVLGGGPLTLGFLTAASGVGALAGALYLASRKTVIGLGKIIVWSTTAGGVGLVFLSVCHSLLFSVFFIVIASLGIMIQLASCNTILQNIVDDDKRGRVMSFYTMAFLGMAPIGSLWAGSLANVSGAPIVTLIGGVSCFVLALHFARGLPALRKAIRPIYIKKGIIPEVATGIQAVTNLSTAKD